MKKYIYYSFLLFLLYINSKQGVAQQKELRILFIGNSYTYYNQLPAMLQKMALSKNIRIHCESIAKSGAYLKDHAQNISVIQRIEQGQWDYVVLQEQSIAPLIEQVRETITYPSLEKLHKAIQKARAKTILFMTWGRKNGGEYTNKYAQGDRTPLFQNYWEMQEALEKVYKNMAKELNSLIAPVGTVWKEALKEDQTWNFWNADQSHPNLYGSYLTACVFYQIILQKSPVNISYTSDLSNEVALKLQRIAAKVISIYIEKEY